MEIYKASAGSGKTHLLTLQYLLLLFEAPDAYRRILAVTFTNKATAEMKDRILGELQKMAAGVQSSIADQLLEAGAAPDSHSLAMQASALYSAILHDYSRFSIHTIDAFTQKLIRSCSFELGIDAGFSIALNTRLVSEALAEKLKAGLGQKDFTALRKVMTALAMERLEAGKSWDFQEDLLDLSAILFQEKFLEFDQKLQQTRQNPDELIKALSDSVFAFRNTTRQQLFAFAQEGQQLLASQALDVADFSYGKAGFAGRFFKLSTVIEDPISQRVRDVLELGKKPYAQKAAKDIVQRIENILPELLQLFTKWGAFYQQNIRALNTAEAIAKNLSYLRLVLLMGQELAAWRTENQALLINDTHYLLRQLSLHVTPDFIYEKTGNRFKHFLLDEFQDTSDFQYHNFKPLLANSLGQGGYNLLVGDVKQAIYRWRNGDWRLLQQVLPHDFASFAPTQATLVQNYRSARPIIEFNNYLFSLLPHLLQQQLNSKLMDAPDTTRQALEGYYGRMLTDAYADARQEVPPTAAAQGLVQLTFVPSEAYDGEDATYENYVLGCTHEAIGQLLAQGYAPGDLAILCRSNRQARQSIEQLMLLQQADGTAYPLLSADALLIGNNATIQVLVAAMEWVADTSHRLAETLLRRHFALLQGQAANTLATFRKADNPAEVLPADWVNDRLRLRTLPVADMVSDMIARLQLGQQPADMPFLLAFLDVVRQWSGRSDEGLMAFLQYWHSEGSQTSLPAPEGANAVEVVTIHKSKGLAYRVVLMPFCNWPLEPLPAQPPLLWAAMEGTAFPHIPMLPVKYGNVLRDSELSDLYFAELAQTYLDNLNLLYVAFTRARSRLLLWAPAPPVQKDGSFGREHMRRISTLLYAAAQPDQPAEHAEDAALPAAFDADTLVWTWGSTPQAPAAAPQPPATPIPNVFVPWRLHRSIAARQVAEVPGVDMLPRQKGVLLHQLVARLDHPASLAKVLHEMLAKGLINPTQATEYEAFIQRLLALPLLQPWCAGAMQRLAERGIVTPDGSLQRPDLILYSDTLTYVIDFKFTDKQEVAHRRQVEAYAAWLRQLGFASVQAYLLYGLSPEVVVCQV